MSKAVKALAQLSFARRIWACAAIAVALVLVGAAERDIQRRPATEVRGDKWLWRLACLNALGAVNYFWWGRRKD
jgi:hypothetical protein